jgi:hypothetical protein
LKSQNHREEIDKRSTATTWVKISTGSYIFVLIAISTLIIYTWNPIPYIDLNNLVFLSSAVLYITIVVIAIDITIAGSSKNIALEITFRNSLEVIEGSDTSLIFLIKPSGIANLLSIKKIHLSSDKGLKISKWRFDRKNQSLELYLSGYPGRHVVDGLYIEIETPLSILRIGFNFALEKPIEIRIVPMKSRHMFNVEAVVPYIPLIEGRSSRRKGVGSEVMSIREFTPHDDYKKIHWKATARTSKLMVKEYEHRMYRNALLVISIHYLFYLGDPPPLVFLFRTVVDVIETLTSIGMRVALGIITEEDIKIVDFIDRFRIHEVYRILSEVKWPKDLSITTIRYTSSNRILKWFVQTVTKNICRDPCIVMLAIDPLDDLDLSAVNSITSFLKSSKHSVKILLTTPSTLRFMYSSKVGMEDISEVMGEMTRVRRMLTRFGVRDVYLPTVYLKT